MGRLIEAVGAYFAPEGEIDLELRFYQGLCLVAAGLTLFVVIPVNAFQTLPAIISIGCFVFGLVALLLYWAAQHGHYYPKTFFLGLLLTLDVGWYPNAGSHGSIPYYFLAAALYPLVFFRGATRWGLVALALGDATVLLWLERWFPELVTPFQSDWDRMLDLTTGLLISAVAAVLMLWVVFTGYARERQRLRETVNALDRNRTLLSSLIDSTDDMVWLVDPRTFALVLGNAALASFCRTNFGVETGPGMPLAALPADTAAEWRALYDRVLAEGPFTVEYATRGRVALVSINPVTHEGETIGLAGFAKEITELKQAEEERARIDAQLVESQRMESLGKLAGGVAHDFNNMLTGIMGYADLMLDEEREPSRQRHLQSILAAATRSSELTQKLLAFARHGKNVVVCIELGGMVRDSIAMLRPSFRRDVDVVVELDATWTVDGDPSQMNQLVVNLCMNANEAMTKGGTLTVRTWNVTLDGPTAERLGVKPGEHVALRVSDSGVGMCDDVKARIFEPFFTTKVGGQVKGTGLGLSTVYGIVHLHQGAIDVDSAPGKGARFTVYLPRGSRAPEPKPTVAGWADGGGLILVVEDEEMLREFTTEALERLGYTCVTAVDGEDGVRVFMERHEELAGVILDLKMPRKEGRQAFLEMREIDPSVPVLICSGYGDNEEAQGLIALGARALLPKPFKMIDLALELTRLRS